MKTYNIEYPIAGSVIYQIEAESEQKAREIGKWLAGKTYNSPQAEMGEYLADSVNPNMVDRFISSLYVKADNSKIGVLLDD